MVLLKHVYCLRADTLTADNGEITTVYGITAFKEEATVANLFSDKAEAEAFVEMCNREGLEPVHLEYVIDDLLARK